LDVEAHELKLEKLFRGKGASEEKKVQALKD
jgi:hypothetical protein